MVKRVEVEKKAYSGVCVKKMGKIKACLFPEV